MVGVDRLQVRWRIVADDLRIDADLGQRLPKIIADLLGFMKKGAGSSLSLKRLPSAPRL